MARTFLTNIEEANTQLNAALDKVDTHEAAMALAKTATTTAENKVVEVQSKLTTETERANKAITDLGVANARADKAEKDLKDAKQATVTGAAAPGVPPVNGATTNADDKDKVDTSKLTGRARSTAAMSSMQPTNVRLK